MTGSKVALGFKAVIERELGLAFEDARSAELERVMWERLAITGLDAEAYVERLASGAGIDELYELAPHLTVRETYFFRNPQQFAAFRDVAIPQHQTRDSRAVRVLSAGCASGEEAYSLAMTVADRYGGLDGSFSITAFDLNPVVLEQARRARFPRWSLRETAPDAIERWFTQDRSDFVLDSSIRERVDFFQSNLARDDVRVMAGETYQVIFCRNVLMYFSRDACRRAVARLARSLVPGGYLFLGHAETLRGMSDDFELCNSHGVFYYRRKDAIATLPAERGPPLLAPDRSIAPIDASWSDTIHASTERIAHLSARLVSSKAPEPQSPLDALRVTVELLGSERFVQALAALRASPSLAARDPDALTLEAVLLVQAGELAEAEAACVHLLQRDGMNAGAHYLLAVCFEARGELEQSARYDESAIHLDPTFAMPHVHLGLMYRRSGRLEASRRELARARTLLEHEDSARLLLYGAGFGRDALLALCDAETMTVMGAP